MLAHPPGTHYVRSSSSPHPFHTSTKQRCAYTHPRFHDCCLSYASFLLHLTLNSCYDPSTIVMQCLHTAASGRLLPACQQPGHASKVSGMLGVKPGCRGGFIHPPTTTCLSAARPRQQSKWYAGCEVWVPVGEGSSTPRQLPGCQQPGHASKVGTQPGCWGGGGSQNCGPHHLEAGCIRPPKMAPCLSLSISF